ncbi:MAG TPA: type IV toxin-antitoxin system AbiEi family antitoxin domain-containing protein [Thermoanaerobaculia bacterium]|nr:type IV toxin-antitoxin system AbiEi family antitoxin domain-containing protein [Thermoanaerobaculia bacterium]
MTTERRDRRHTLHRLAALQGGYFTAAQALEQGYSYQAQQYHVHHGNWLRVGRGLFRLPEWPTSEHDDLMRWHLWSKGRAVISHDTALALHDLGDLNPERVHLTVPPNFRQRSDRAVLHRAEIPSAEVLEHGSFRVTTPVRALLEVATGDLDQERLSSAVRDAVSRGLATPHALRDRADHFGHRAALRIERALAVGPN